MPRMLIILAGLVLMLVATVAWLSDSNDEPHNAPGSHRSSTKR